MTRDLLPFEWSSTAGRVHPILEDVADCVVAQTSFRRVLVSLYSSCVTPGTSVPKARVLDVALRGVPEEQTMLVQRFAREEDAISGERFRAQHRVGESYFYPQGAELPGRSLKLPSSRTFLGSSRWATRDILLVPFWVDNQVVGHISVDDPADGCRPGLPTIRRLEQIARMASAALHSTCDLEQLSETHRVFRLLAESAMTGVLVVRDAAVQYVNSRACELTGYSQDELLALAPWWQIFDPDDRPSVWGNGETSFESPRTVRAIRRDGRRIWLALGARELDYLEGQALAIQFFDITGHVEVEQSLKEKALRDPLTGLLNRAYFDDAIHTELNRSKRYRRPLSLMMADLARFKQVNDELGHQEGDRVLVGVSRVFLSQLRESDWIVRYGGDEFLFVLPETGPELEPLESRLVQSVITWSRENDRGVAVEADFGWATWTPETDRPIAKLLREADEMLYQNKERRSSVR
jgi:diguanylate cyclase (GGDEF)-like protein/PAS domain S-box-containing protein